MILDSVDSTSDELRRRLQRGAPAGTVALAETQTAGRGRLGRAWFSPRGDGLYLSASFRPLRPLRELPRWSIAASAAACLACRRIAGVPVAVEWPNDVVHAGRKVAGTLVEVRAVGDAVEDLIVGTGFNVNQEAGAFPADLATRATSLRAALGGAIVDRERLAAAYLGALDELSLELERGAWDRVLGTWLPLAPAAVGARVRVLAEEGGAPWDAVTRGLDRWGGLVVEDASGGRRTVRMADAVRYEEA